MPISFSIQSNRNTVYEDFLLDKFCKIDFEILYSASWKLELIHFCKLWHQFGNFYFWGYCVFKFWIGNGNRTLDLGTNFGPNSKVVLELAPSQPGKQMVRWPFGPQPEFVIYTLNDPLSWYETAFSGSQFRKKLQSSLPWRWKLIIISIPFSCYTVAVL